VRGVLEVAGHSAKLSDRVGFAPIETPQRALDLGRVHLEPGPVDVSLNIMSQGVPASPDRVRDRIVVDDALIGQEADAAIEVQAATKEIGGGDGEAA
jgi:hypothetical protein